MGTNSPLRWANADVAGTGRRRLQRPESIRLGARCERDRADSLPEVSSRTAPAATRSVSRNFQSARAGINLTDKIAICRCKSAAGFPHKVQGIVRILPGIVRHFERKTALSRMMILCRPALNQTNVHRGVRWIEACSLILLQLGLRSFPCVQSNGPPRNRRGANLRISAVCFTAAHGHLGQAVSFTGAALVAVRFGSRRWRNER